MPVITFKTKFAFIIHTRRQNVHCLPGNKRNINKTGIILILTKNNNNKNKMINIICNQLATKGFYNSSLNHGHNYCLQLSTSDITFNTNIQQPCSQVHLFETCQGTA